ncbi:hypothetical protein C8J57DRAFT_1537678 [Mycena rebaudengoi]|nr:hypothetical protein C8J57DRAFT_1537678 [Mycena rebaudengoi]
MLPPDWQDPRIPADHWDHMISFEDMAEAWDHMYLPIFFVLPKPFLLGFLLGLAEHGFTVGTFHDPLIDGDDSAHVLGRDELQDFASSISTPLSHFYNPDVEEQYTPPSPHPLLWPFHAPGVPHPPPLHRYYHRPRVVCSLCCVLGGPEPDFSSSARCLHHHHTAVPQGLNTAALLLCKSSP